MAIPDASSETSQAEGEGDSPDSPLPHDVSKQTPTTAVNGAPISNGTNFPLPPADSLLMGDKQPGLTRGALQKLSTVGLSTSSSSSDQQKQRPCPGPHSPNSLSPVPTSPTDSAPPSRGPSRPPSQPASRAPSMSAGTSGGKVIIPPEHNGRERRGSQANDFPFMIPTSRKPPSVHSDKSDGGHKFTLKDLLANGPKLNRKSSQRSTSSRVSDSDTEGRPRSANGESTTSMSQKYGVCQKLAIGKGATSVVRLAHKWDRSEEKLYAIKVDTLGWLIWSLRFF